LRKYLLVFDANCGPCNRFKQTVDLLDTYDRFGFKSLTQADEEGFLDSIPKPMRYISFHLVTPEGVVISGANAIPTLVGLLPMGRPVSGLITSAPGGLRLIGFLYQALSGLHNARTCQYNSNDVLF